VETARDVYRFQVKVPAGKTASETVTEERDEVSQVVLTNAPDDAIRVFLRTDITSKAAKEALEKALALKGKVDGAKQDLEHANQQLADIERDQTRVRANLKETPPEAEAYKKYLAKLNQQETEIDQIRERIKKLRDDELAQRKAYETFLANLDVE
jgi:chromosome segregation ATPase